MEANEIIENEEIAYGRRIKPIGLIPEPCAEVVCNNGFDKKVAAVAVAGVVAGVIFTDVYKRVKKHIANRKILKAAAQKAKEDDAKAEVIDVDAGTENVAEE